MLGVLEVIFRRSLWTAFAAASLSFAACVPAAANTTSVKRQAAQTQFSRAEAQRAALNSKPLAARALAEYKQVVTTYRRVYLITPHAAEVPEALVAVGELNAEMGERFGRNYYQSAVDTYQFLIHEYPASRCSSDAMLRVARLQKERLGEPALAAKTYEEFLKRYRRSPRHREAQEGLAEIALLRSSNLPAFGGVPRNAPALSAKGKEKPLEAEAAAAARGEIPRVTRISTAATPNSTRVIIDLEDKVAYSSARIKNPERIYFDIHAARLTPEMANRSLPVSGDLLKAVRVAQNHAGIVRIVLNVTDVQDYSASLNSNPPQLIVDLYGSPSALRAAEMETSVSRLPGKTEARKSSATHEPLSVNNTSLTRARKSSSSAERTAAKGPSAPEPTRDGQATLTRTLGLKIGRIVIDAGHGGHDTGTIGPTGLMEKDLCLDVALRLGRTIEQRLPGAEVIFTRADDTFVPLERRTEIANEAKADLFISVHANSSRDHAARGVETYYLTLKGSPDAMEVAARENAAANGGVHELQELVKKIARTEKIEESRELASDIQDSLSLRVQKTGRKGQNRGVRKAPFMVLIGADMPSILTEISFLSNPADEQLLKKPDYRQRLADGLYQGVVVYLQSLNSVTYNVPARGTAGHPRAPAASAEQSRNQQ